MKTILYWTDQEDYDNGMNHGTEIFESNEKMINRLNELKDERPKIEFLAFERCVELEIEPIETVISFRIKKSCRLK